MVEVEIRGKKFPLCLTVAALDQINEQCGGLKGLDTFLNGDGDIGKAANNTAWLLALLIQEGENNRIVCAKFDGAPVERKEVPTHEDLCQMVTIRTLMRYRGAVIDAVSHSMQQEIEAEPSKNAENAEQG